MNHLIPKHFLTLKDTSGHSPLHKATTRGHELLVNLLVANGANVNSENTSHETPLMNAAAKGKASIVEFLIEKGAKVLINIHEHN